MRLLPRTRRTKLRLAGATVLAVLLSVGADASMAKDPPATQENLLAWHTKMIETPQPSTHGCFTATYPRLIWREITCVAPPAAPMAPKITAPNLPRDIGGDGTGLVVEKPAVAGLITRAQGNFERVTGLPPESPVPPVPPVKTVLPNGTQMANSYTLQLNTNYFKVEECEGARAVAECRGWKQFVFANNGSGTGDSQGGRVYIEYWLLHYNKVNCPDGWTLFPENGDPNITETACERKSDSAPLPNVPIQRMSNASFQLVGSVTASARGDIDTVLFNDGQGNMNSTRGVNILTPPGPVEPEEGWTQAEFNVFGFGSGSKAVFDNHASFNVRTTIEDGSPVKPGCKDFGYSNESNNLNFGPPSQPVPSTPAPAVVFGESVNGLAQYGCKDALIFGDTHEYTFAGLLYDFQASGDFVEAQVAGSTTFEVQTRKVSGAPTWPNTSVNRSVAMRMGATKVAVCDGTRLVVDGTTTTLASGGSLLLPTGVDIRRVNNVYTIKDTSGNSIRVSANTSYVDLGIGLGPAATTVRGLLGNPNDDPTRLQAKDGTTFAAPIPFPDLYTRFGSSWRVTPLTTLLQPCNPIAVANPTAPFYAGNLDPNLRRWAQDICSARRVAQTWLDTCALDVAVVSPNAATAYVGLGQPFLNANPPQPPICSPGGCTPPCPPNAPVCPDGGRQPR